MSGIKKSVAKSIAAKYYREGTSKYTILVELLSNRLPQDTSSLGAKAGVLRIPNRIKEIEDETPIRFTRTQALVGVGNAGNPAVLYSFDEDAELEVA